MRKSFLSVVMCIFVILISYYYYPSYFSCRSHRLTLHSFVCLNKYDWRLSPKDMELRDRYYTNTKQMIEQLYTQNNNTPIVLLCHSMGCKVAHYFLNFIADNYNQSWIDQYIHTYVSLYIYIYIYIHSAV